jgi:hypothetical protein
MQLLINTPGTFLTQKDECFRLKQQEGTLDVSSLKVESIVISNLAMISTQVLVRDSLKYGPKQMILSIMSWERRISWMKSIPPSRHCYHHLIL